MIRAVFVVVVGMLVAACSDDSSTLPEPGVLLATSPTRSVLIIAADARNTHPVLNGAKPEGWWIKLDIPQGSPDGVFTLTSPTPSVKFEQNYSELCDPSVLVENPPTCWIFESYTSGETDLKGTVTVKTTTPGLDVSYYVEWEGITDRFGTPQWYLHISEQTTTIPIEQIEEVPL